MSDSNRRVSRMAGCVRLGVLSAVLGLLTSLVADLMREPINLCRDGPSHVWPTRGRIQSLLIGLNAFYEHRSRWPAWNDSLDKRTMEFTTRGSILATLLGKDASTNPEGIEFSWFRPTRTSKDGLWRHGDDWVLSDLWGNEYRILLDLDDDGKITNPDPLTAKELPDIAAAVAVYSSGPDGNAATWEDNIRSWR